MNLNKTWEIFEQKAAEDKAEYEEFCRWHHMEATEDGFKRHMDPIEYAWAALEPVPEEALIASYGPEGYEEKAEEVGIFLFNIFKKYFFI